MTAHLIRRIVLTCLLAGPWADAQALVRYDFEQAMFTEPPYPVLDHCVVEENGLYHLFYLRGDPAVNIGHATTTDFVHWTPQPPVLTTGTWDNKALWAPQLFRPQGNPWWYMFYTGVNTVNAQQIGVAFSSDLMAWFKYPPPIYHPDTAWAEWTETSFAHGRDPHVVEHGGRYYLFATAKTNDNRGAVACAVSDNLVEWEDIGPIFVNTSWHVLESVFIFRYNDRWQMFFTEEAVGGSSAMASDSLLSGWNIATRRIIDNGHAPQVTDTHLGQMFSRHAVYNDAHGNYQHVLRFTPMVWLGQIPAVPKPLPLAGAWTFVSGDAFYYQPTWNHNAAVRDEVYDKTWNGDGWINTYEYYTGPLGYGNPGIIQGDGRTGIIRSQTFTLEGNSMSVLVGGGNFPAQCYVALVDAGTAAVLFSETGRNRNEMDRRRWDIRPYLGRSVYVEIADLATETFGHICVDDIIESYELVGSSTSESDGAGSGRIKNRPGAGSGSAAMLAAQPERPARLHANSPNPFNPQTQIAFEIPREAHVRLEVFDATGARVRTLVDAPRAAGRHAESWNGTDAAGVAVSSGVYFCRLTVGGAVIDTRKMVLLK